MPTPKTADRGPWIQTRSGKRFHILDPRSEEIDINDIATALSRQARFSGHTVDFLSVAQHSVNISYMVGDQFALWGLLHDASEAYLVDVPRPIKPLLTEYGPIEVKVMLAIAKKFNLPPKMPETVKRCDVDLLYLECRAQMPGSQDWQQWQQDPDYWSHLTSDRADMSPWSSQESRSKFMSRFNEIQK
jgi:5'-deoxynucleotidase YfbR-like HD superfamily hydrolase